MQQRKLQYDLQDAVFSESEIRFDNVRISLSDLERVRIKKSPLGARFLAAFPIVYFGTLLALSVFLPFETEWIERYWGTLLLLCLGLTVSPIPVLLYMAPVLNKYFILIRSRKGEWCLRSTRISLVHVAAEYLSRATDEVKWEFEYKPRFIYTERAVENMAKNAHLDHDTITMVRISYAGSSLLCLATGIVIVLLVYFDVLSVVPATVILAFLAAQLIVYEVLVRKFNRYVSSLSLGQHDDGPIVILSRLADTKITRRLVRKSRSRLYGLIPRYDLEIVDQKVTLYDVFRQPGFVEKALGEK